MQNEIDITRYISHECVLDDKKPRVTRLRFFWSETAAKLAIARTPMKFRTNATRFSPIRASRGLWRVEDIVDNPTIYNYQPIVVKTVA